MKDPFGDFDMIFTAGYFGLKILEIPVSIRQEFMELPKLKDLEMAIN